MTARFGGRFLAWTDENIALAIRLWNEGQSASQIAAVLGCTKNAVIGKLHRLGYGNAIRGKPYTGFKAPSAYKAPAKPQPAPVAAKPKLKAVQTPAKVKAARKPRNPLPGGKYTARRSNLTSIENATRIHERIMLAVNADTRVAADPNDTPKMAAARAFAAGHIDRRELMRRVREAQGS